jgi:hypothetical protein
MKQRRTLWIHHYMGFFWPLGATFFCKALGTLTPAHCGNVNEVPRSNNDKTNIPFLSTIAIVSQTSDLVSLQCA